MVRVEMATRSRDCFRRAEGEMTNSREEWALVKMAKVTTGSQSPGGSNKRCMASQLTLTENIRGLNLAAVMCMTVQVTRLSLQLSY
jgi:hypothetical protein